jgi:hypothetical protein
MVVCIDRLDQCYRELLHLHLVLKEIIYLEEYLIFLLFSRTCLLLFILVKLSLQYVNLSLSLQAICCMDRPF